MISVLSRRVLSLFVGFSVLFSLIYSISVSAQSDVGYVVNGTVTGNDLTVEVSIENIDAYAGRIALQFDNNVIELADDSSLSNAILHNSAIAYTNEGHDESLLVSNAGGYVMFPWYSSNYSSINSLGKSTVVATIPFRIKDGHSTDDFTRNTLGIRYMNENMLNGWDSGADIVGRGLDKYMINSPYDEYVCNISFEYPNCDVIPIVYYNTSFSVTDLSGNPISNAEVRIDAELAVTDANGYVNFMMTDGVYGYRVQSEGYQPQSGYITVSGGDITKSVMLRNYAQMVSQTASDLEIEFNSGDDAANVTSGIGLQTVGPNGEVITWSSSSPSVISPQGIVITQDSDVNVVMTATVSLGNAVATREFNLTVRSSTTSQVTDEAIVKLDLEALEIGYAPGDNKDSVTSDITLPEAGSYGSSIIWTISHSEIIDEYGTVTRPDMDTSVRLTARVMRGNYSQEVLFDILVKAANAEGKSDQDLVNDVYNALQLGYAEGDSANSVTQSLILPAFGADGVQITWSSSHPDVITPYGGVTRQSADTVVTLTATVTKNFVSKMKQFTVTVSAAPVAPDKPNSDVDNDKINADAVAADKAAVRPVYAPGDTSNAVTANMTLPTSGVNGSSIFWESSNPAIISSAGVVSRSSSDANVTLTAVLSKGNASDRVSFNVTVLGVSSHSTENEEEIVSRVTNALDVIYKGSDSADRVTMSVILPTEGSEGTSISWQSSNTNVISTNGGVTRKMTDTTVVLTATVSLGSASQQKQFTLNVVAASKPSGSSVVNGDKDGNSSTPGTDPSQQQIGRFTDIASVPWAQEAILALADQGVIKGTSETTFSPNDPISRGDFVTLLVRLLGLNGEIGEGFADVPTDSYYYETITTAKSMGVIDGVGNNMFEPESSISRQDMMTMTYRALSRLGLTENWTKSDLSSFGDTNEISDYAFESVQFVVGGGLIAGDENGNIAPLANTTRAETAVFLYRLSAQL